MAFPQLTVSGSQLTVPYCEMVNKIESTSDFHFGPDGVATTMTILINWADLPTALQQILGYSYRVAIDQFNGLPALKRVIPMQHPTWNQLYAKSITRCIGLKLQGKAPAQFSNLNAGWGALLAAPASSGAIFQFALLTIAFWRPPYYVLSDSAVYNSTLGFYQEWLRYVDKHWTINTEMLSREACTYQWRDNTGPVGLIGPMGQQISHAKITRTWYDVPEQCIFAQSSDGSLNGPPYRFMFTQTPCVNPITYGVGVPPTSFTYFAGSPIVGTVNSAIGGSVAYQQNFQFAGGLSYSQVSNTISGLSAGFTASQIAVGFRVHGSGIPRGTVVLSTNSGAGTCTISNNPTYAPAYGILPNPNPPGIYFENPANRFYGFPTGTLRLDSVEITPRPLQLPTWLMNIPTFGLNEPLAQQQYNVTFHFDYFDPTTNSAEPFLGHNLAPYPGNNFWYSSYPQNDAQPTPSTSGPFQTLYPYSDFSDLFKVR